MYSAHFVPVPIDMPLPADRDEVGIYAATGVRVDQCRGADAEGECPRPHADGSVACAGCVVVLPAAIRGSRAWEVPAGYQHCLLGSYAAFRRA